MEGFALKNKFQTHIQQTLYAVINHHVTQWTITRKLRDIRGCPYDLRNSVTIHLIYWQLFMIFSLREKWLSIFILVNQVLISRSVVLFSSWQFYQSICCVVKSSYLVSYLLQKKFMCMKSRNFPDKVTGEFNPNYVHITTISAGFGVFESFFGIKWYRYLLPALLHTG